MSSASTRSRSYLLARGSHEFLALPGRSCPTRATLGRLTRDVKRSTGTRCRSLANDDCPHCEGSTGLPQAHKVDTGRGRRLIAESVGMATLAETSHLTCGHPATAHSEYVDCRGRRIGQTEGNAQGTPRRVRHLLLQP